MTPVRRSRGHLIWVIAVLTCGIVLAACGGASESLSLKPGTVSACYRALPIARVALHDSSAKLQGVHRMPFDTLVRTLPGVTLPTGDDDTDDTEVCAFAFTGKFTPGQVTDAPPQSQGSYAVVAVDSKHLDLVISYVGAQLPKHPKRKVAVD
jgi:hypothetical protein